MRAIGSICFQLAWTTFFVLLVLSFGFLIALEIHSRACIVGWVACGGQGMVSMATGYLATVGNAGNELKNVTSFCDSLYGPTSNDTATCSLCTAEASECLQLSGVLAIAMLTSFLGTFLPCFFFYCCASSFKPAIPPEVDAEIRKMQSRREALENKPKTAKHKAGTGEIPTSAWH